LPGCSGRGKNRVGESEGCGKENLFSEKKLVRGSMKRKEGPGRRCESPKKQNAGSSPKNIGEGLGRDSIKSIGGGGPSHPHAKAEGGLGVSKIPQGDHERKEGGRTYLLRGKMKQKGTPERKKHRWKKGACVWGMSGLQPKRSQTKGRGGQRKKGGRKGVQPRGRNPK